MAKLGDILEKEKNRSESGMLRTIYLYQEGTFYRAYEWSAWLCFRYIKQFKPTHRLLKDSADSIVFIGFPVTSLQKYTPDGGEVTYMDDNNVAVSTTQVPTATSGRVLPARTSRTARTAWASIRATWTWATTIGTAVTPCVWCVSRPFAGHYPSSAAERRRAEG